MELKQYQRQLLDDFCSYLARTRELADPEVAFRESTKEWFGHALPYTRLPGAEEVPYVCLRVPTGGGKTRIAGHAIRRVLDTFLASEYALVLWLVPSEPIREQTLYGLKTPGEMLHEDMKDLFGSVHVLDIQEALYLQPSTLNTGTTIIVSTMQSFKRDSPDGLRVYRQNGTLMAHFDGVSESQRGDHSLVDAIKLRRPFIIIDEAHNQGSPLAVDTILRLNPSCILELTATPDRNTQPSNVLRSVSAAVLQAEDMLKLPLELAIHAEWKYSLAEAISRLRQLEIAALEEHKLTGERIEPVVMLIQAERKAASKETFTPERVKEHLIHDFQIQAESIAIATGAVDELGDKKLDEPGYPQFIITIDKLREGWDCPYAYVLFSFRNTTSATAVEQILGRVLRMPHAKRKENESLNHSYAYVVSNELAATVQGLRDGLVQNGFERLEAKDLIRGQAEDEYTLELFPTEEDITVPLPDLGNGIQFPDPEKMETLPKSVREKIDISNEMGTITIKGTASDSDRQKIASVFSNPDAARNIRESIDTVRAMRVAPSVPDKTPAERGEKGRVPLLSINQFGLFEKFDSTPLLDSDWEISSFEHKLSEAEFGKDFEAMRRARLSISELEKVECNVYDYLDSQLALFNREEGWEPIALVNWLDRNIEFPYSERDRKVAWINAVVSYLMEDRDFTLDELAYRKFRLRGAIERKLTEGLQFIKQREFESLLEDKSKFSVRDEHSIEFANGRYGYTNPYSGLIHLKRHFFPIIGELASIGEEFQCAEYIANKLEGVEWWVRNLPQKETSFWLQTSSDRFYPDFIVRLQNGLTLAVEYKGALIADSRDSIEKKRIGELWAMRSEGRCRFVWVENKNWQVLKEAVK